MVHDLSLLRPDPALGYPPDGAMRFIPELADQILEMVTEDDNKPHAIDGTRFRGSMAGYCTRRIAYYETGTPVTDPIDVASAWRMYLGTHVHELLQAAVHRVYRPDTEAHVQTEVVCDYRTFGLDGSGHADLVLDLPTDEPGDTHRIVVELKSVNGFGFKLATTTFRGPPEGPKSGAVIQGALNAAALDADHLVIANLSLENVSPQMAHLTDDVYARFGAEWTFDRDQITELALAEAERVGQVHQILDQSDGDPTAVPRMVTDTDVHPWAQITDPVGKENRGLWELRDSSGNLRDAGDTWVCGYCPYREGCASDG